MTLSHSNIFNAIEVHNILRVLTHMFKLKFLQIGRSLACAMRGAVLWSCSIFSPSSNIGLGHELVQAACKQGILHPPQSRIIVRNDCFGYPS